MVPVPNQLLALPPNLVPQPRAGPLNLATSQSR